MKIKRIIPLATALFFSLPMLAQHICCSKADSLLSEYKYTEALEGYLSAHQNDIKRMSSARAMNAAIAAAQCDKDSLAIILVQQALEADPNFFDERISVTELLQDCRLMPRWDALQQENENRLAKAKIGYDINLRNILLDIYHSDQNPRGHLIAISKSNPEDKEAIRQYWKEINRNDSLNLARTVELLDKYGWISTSIAGSANQALFYVIQHASPDIIDKYLPVFEKAARNNEIPRTLFAKMYDRRQMYAGKPQRYGTQLVQKDVASKEMVLWKIEDPDKVNALRKEMDLPPLPDFPL